MSYLNTQKQTSTYGKIKTLKENNNIQSMMTNTKENGHVTYVKKAELKLAAFFAANNVAFSVIDHRSVKKYFLIVNYVRISM